MHNMQIMQSKSPPQAAGLVVAARRRLGLKQGEFAKCIGKSQAVVSRYERGQVDPPGEVIMRCMHIMSQSNATMPIPASTWDETLNALEAAVALVKSLRDASLNAPKAT